MNDTTMVVCDTCLREFEKRTASVRDRNYCSNACQPENIYHGEKWELIRAVAVGSNDPTPQLRHYLVKRAWMQFGLPDGCIIRSKRTGKMKIVQRGEFIALSPDDWDAIAAPNRAHCGATVLTSQTAWHERSVRCPGAAWEA